MTRRLAWAALLASAFVHAQPRLFLEASDFERINKLAESTGWARTVRDSILTSASNWPKRHLDRFGLQDLAIPEAGGQWTHHYVCPTHGVRLEYSPPATSRCPMDGQTFSGWPYEQVILTNRHSDLAEAARDLALAFRLTGKREYGEQAAWILNQYAARYAGYSLHDVNNGTARTGGRVLAQTLDESVWLIPIAWAYDLLRGSGVLEDDVRIQTDLLRAAVQTIQRYDAGISNWQSWHNAAIAAAGFALGDDSLISAAIEGKSGFRFQMKNSILGEGFWYEGAWSYHFYALDALAQTAEMATRNGIDLWSDPALRGLFTTPLALTFADGGLPAFNDSTALNITGQDRLYEMAYARYRDPALVNVLGKRARSRSALFWGVPELNSGSQAELTTAVFRDSGYVVLRGGGTDHAVIAKFGPHGGGHGHYDKLNFISFARNGILGLDPGTQPYAAPTHNTWDKMTVAHNTLVVDEQRQGEATGSLRWFQKGEGWAATSASAGPAYRNAELTRTMFLTPDYLLDLSEAQATDGQPHTFDWVYHNNGSISTPLPRQPYSSFGRANGYQHLTDNAAATTGDAWQLTFDDMPAVPQSYGSASAQSGAVRGRFEIDNERVHSGRYSGRLSYEFGQTGYILFSTPVLVGPPASKPVGARVAVYGDGSGHRISLRLIDSSDERFVSPPTVINWTGWRVVEVQNPEKWSHFGGDNDGVFDGAVSFCTLQVDSVAGSPRTGHLTVDDFVILYAEDETFMAAAFELDYRRVRVWMLGVEDTTVVTGKGLGPDLRRPVPFVMARRKAASTRYVTLLEPYGETPAVASFGQTRPGEFEVQGPGWTDTIRITADGASYLRVVTSRP